MGSDGCNTLLEEMKRMHNLTILSLSNCGLDDGLCSEDAPLLTLLADGAQWPALECLYLNGNRGLTEGGKTKIRNAWKKGGRPETGEDGDNALWL